MWGGYATCYVFNFRCHDRVSTHSVAAKNNQTKSPAEIAYTTGEACEVSQLNKMPRIREQKRDKAERDSEPSDVTRALEIFRWANDFPENK